MWCALALNLVSVALFHCPPFIEGPSHLWLHFYGEIMVLIKGWKENLVEDGRKDVSSESDSEHLVWNKFGANSAKKFLHILSHFRSTKGYRRAKLCVTLLTS